MDDGMQKVTAFHMPVAIGVAKDWGQMPLHVKSLFYWWTPDATFLELDPVAITFPPYDFNAYLRGPCVEIVLCCQEGCNPTSTKKMIFNLLRRRA